ncbi:hypothetical protein RchiOBHm_Chr4g0444571 [Rosa chinensis]|uniref:Uncharacterized protein n=1 Tax=Rosa chinensis TaxID=74649 RepID=A0A2P6R458_ROSCH|nr:hypothetical protein RchiOBHm_Chr4g0444571 [Rosa chinensis]
MIGWNGQPSEEAVTRWSEMQDGIHVCQDLAQAWAQVGSSSAYFLGLQVFFKKCFLGIKPM